MRLSTPSGVRIRSAIALALILGCYVSGVLYLHPTSFFGFTQDDTLYFSSAKALAEGKGYILPSVPGTPPATKYPVLYPWLLSWVWRWNPSFPANLYAAVALNVLFGCVFVIMTFALLRQLKGISENAALLVTTICAVHPLVLFYTANVITDVPFAAMALTAIVLAGRALERGTRTLTIGSGVFAGLSILLRALGAPIAAGVFVALALRRSWRQAALFAASVLPFLAGLFWRSVVSVPRKPPVMTGACSGAWQDTWFYYTSYPAELAASITNHAFWHNVRANVTASLLQPGTYLFHPSSVQSKTLGLVIVVILSVISLRGMVRQVQLGGMHPLHYILAFYLIPVLIWDYPAVDRFLLPFLPVFATGFLIECKYLGRQIRISFEKTPAEAKITAGIFCVAGLLLVATVPFSWWRGVNFLSQKSRQQEVLLAEKREAYRWLRENTHAGARFVAWEDASAFLYSGRQGMRPVHFLPAGLYRPEVVNAELSCLTSSGRAIGAQYWIIADDDFASQWESLVPRLRSAEQEAENGLDLKFRSQEGRVRIYSLPQRW